MFAYHLVGYSNRVKNDCDSLFAHLARFNFAAIAELHANCKLKSSFFWKKCLISLGMAIQVGLHAIWISDKLSYHNEFLSPFKIIFVKYTQCSVFLNKIQILLSLLQISSRIE